MPKWGRMPHGGGGGQSYRQNSPALQATSFQKALSSPLAPIRAQGSLRWGPKATADLREASRAGNQGKRPLKAFSFLREKFQGWQNL